MRSKFAVVITLIVVAGFWAPAAMAQSGAVGTAGAGTLVVKSMVEKKVDKLPPGPLFWRVETFATLAQAQAAAGPLGLAAESNGKAWLFTLGPAGGSLMSWWARNPSGRLMASSALPPATPRLGMPPTRQCRLRTAGRSTCGH